jgi:hypothetical protein
MTQLLVSRAPSTTVWLHSNPLEPITKAACAQQSDDMGIPSSAQFALAFNKIMSSVIATGFGLVSPSSAQDRCCSTLADIEHGDT